MKDGSAEMNRFLLNGRAVVRPWALAAIAAVFAFAVSVAIAGSFAASSATPTPPTQLFLAASGLGSALVGSAPVGKGPSVVALDAATHTIYVANGNNANGGNVGGNTVSVIDARHCDAQDVS